VLTTASFTDGTVDGPKVYYYYVTAVDGGGQDGDPSALVKVEIEDSLEPVDFLDVGRDHWAYQYISKLASRKIVGGYSDGTFRPANSVTRAEFAKMIVLASGWDLVTPSKPTFNDVPASHWAYKYVETAKFYGVTSGYPDGSFRLGNNIKRAEIAVMVVRSQGYDLDTSGTGFSDINSSHWAYEMVMTAKNKGIVSGYPGGLFKPEGLATRAESSKMISSILE